MGRNGLGASSRATARRHHRVALAAGPRGQKPPLKHASPAVGDDTAVVTARVLRFHFDTHELSAASALAEQGFFFLLFILTTLSVPSNVSEIYLNLNVPTYVLDSVRLNTYKF
jgi:hypothetical protein